MGTPNTKTSGARINEIEPGKSAAIEKVEHGGYLEARKLAKGVMLYWRYKHNGKADRVVIGAYDSSAPPKSLAPTAKGYSVKAALAKAGELALKHSDNIVQGGYRAALKAEEAKAKRDAEAAIDRSKQTLRKMLTAYCDYLEAKGRRSHKDARSIFNCHVFTPWPEIADAPACEVSTDDVVDMLRRTLQSGRGRTSNKLRSYLMAAFKVAMAARTDHSVPVEFKAYGVEANPVPPLGQDARLHNKADKNPLSIDELQAYWQSISAMEGPRGAMLRIHLLSGGQRVEQLVNLRTADIEKDAFVLLDSKGRPGKGPRLHKLPIIGKLKADITSLANDGEYAFSLDQGETRVSASMMANWAKSAGKEIDDFKIKRIRSGVETLLAGAGVSMEIRGRLQSHGIHGVQATHYDAHDYLPEKAKALATLHRLIEGTKTAKVVTGKFGTKR